MSLATAIPAPDQTQRLSPLSEDQRFESNELPDIRPAPKPFATPSRDVLPRRIVERARLSLTKILRRLLRKGETQQGETQPIRPAEYASRNSTLRGKAFLDPRPHLLENLMQLDELDPLPFVVDETNTCNRWRPDGSELPVTGRGSESAPVCVAVERREANVDSTRCPAIDRSESTPGFECRLLDVNMSGIAFHATEPFVRGSILCIHINVASTARVIDARGTVVRCEPAKDGGFQVICRLEKYLRIAEIRDIGRDLFASSIV